MSLHPVRLRGDCRGVLVIEGAVLIKVIKINDGNKKNNRHNMHVIGKTT
jgi:hypothetical protein